MRLLQTLMNVSSRLSPKLYQKLSRLIHTKDIFGLFYVISLISIYFYKMRIDILNIMLSTYAVLSIFQMDMLYINCVCVLKACFKDINNSLQQMQELIVNSGLCVPMFYYKLRNPFLIMKLKILEKQHMMISNTVQMLNTIFSVQLLTSMIITFCEISLNLYIYLVKWHNGLVINLNGQIDELILLAMIYYILKLALIVWTCETCKNQAQQIRTTIHDVFNSTKDKHIKDEVIKKKFNVYIFPITFHTLNLFEYSYVYQSCMYLIILRSNILQLQSFSMQMLHCKNIFSTKSLNIDATFLATVSNQSFVLFNEILYNYFILLLDDGHHYHIYVNFPTILDYVSFLKILQSILHE